MWRSGDLGDLPRRGRQPAQFGLLPQLATVHSCGPKIGFSDGAGPPMTNTDCRTRRAAGRRRPPTDRPRPPVGKDPPVSPPVPSAAAAPLRRRERVGLSLVLVLFVAFGVLV